ncbi:4Fe-4S dicluster domain-containing protein [Fusibacter sp. 3D3]|uniref:4Fe-4S dicluster domain-containing protein n=1 Tax=Fusibacter sp. 3D3 TaxID=1048380 RepID=UPI000853A1DA|nr:4Fe-4S dicluster domain-containing protein [Fusibacter sp. 3D3]GAU75883.1 Cob(III)alamin reductase [Fusibacter sp. 3D3]
MELIQSIKEAGVVGAGGAGFPSHIKLNTTVETLIVNGVECEPLLETDKYYMRHFAEELIRSIEIVGTHLKATRKIIGIKAKYKKEIQCLEHAIQKQNSKIEIKALESFYPAGDEQMLVKEILNLSIPPGGIPLAVGAVVSNVATLLDIEKSIQNVPVTSRVITVTGAVKTPTLIKVPIGTSIKACLDLAGGVLPTLYAVILGGPMMGADCNMAAIESTFVTKTLGGIIVLPEAHPIITSKRLSFKHIINRAASSCIQCRMCTDLCPRFLNGHPLWPHKVMRAIGNGEKSLEAYESALLCCECGICELYACPMGLSPKTVNQKVKQMLLSSGYKRKVTSESEPVITEAHDMRPYRKVYSNRLIARVALSEYAQIHLDDLVSYTPPQVTIGLKQHIGKPAIPCVKTGDVVEAGQCIADIEDGAMGARVHASISGTVTVIENAVVITEGIQKEARHD